MAQGLPPEVEAQLRQMPNPRDRFQFLLNYLRQQDPEAFDSEASQGSIGDVTSVGQDGGLELEKLPDQKVGQRNMIAALVGGGMVGGLGAAGALGGGGAAGGAAATSGVALPAETVGLAGSGFGGVAASTAGGGGILSTLGKVGKYGQSASDIGEAFTNGAAGMRQGRAQDDLAGLSIATANNRAKLDTAKFNMEAPGMRAQQVGRGEIMQTMQDAPMTGDPRVDKWAGGGLRPSAFGPQSREAGGALSRQALQALLSGSDQIDPQLAQRTKAGAGENIASGVGLGLGVLGALGRVRR